MWSKRQKHKAALYLGLINIVRRTAELPGVCFLCRANGKETRPHCTWHGIAVEEAGTMSAHGLQGASCET